MYAVAGMHGHGADPRQPGAGAPEGPPPAEPDAPAGAGPDAGGAAAPAAGVEGGEPFRLARLNLPLIFRLLFFLFLINQDGDRVRLAAMGALCVAIYLHQVGVLRHIPRMRFMPRVRLPPADPRRAGEAAHQRGGLGVEVVTAFVAFFASLIPTWSIEDQLVQADPAPPQPRRRAVEQHEHQD